MFCNFLSKTLIAKTIYFQGDIMSLIRRVDDNWYEARIGDRRGIVPVRYVEVR